MLPLMSQIPCNLRYPIHNALRGIEEDGEESAKVEKFFWMILDGVWWECLMGFASLCNLS
jgi:hypothetical protein